MVSVYKHTQIGYSLLFTYSAVIAVVGYLAVVTNFHPGALVGLLLLLMAVWLFATLTVTVNGQKIELRLGMGVLRKRFPLKDIAGYRLVRNPWYYFLGVRYTPRGWLFAVSGRSAIELEMKSGKTYRIGTDDVDNLAIALEGALDAFPAGP